MIKNKEKDFCKEINCDIQKLLDQYPDKNTKGLKEYCKKECMAYRFNEWLKENKTKSIIDDLEGEKVLRTAANKNGDLSYTKDPIKIIKVTKKHIYYKHYDEGDYLILLKKYWNDGNWAIYQEKDINYDKKYKNGIKELTEELEKVIGLHNRAYTDALQFKKQRDELLKVSEKAHKKLLKLQQLLSKEGYESFKEGMNLLETIELEKVIQKVKGVDEIVK